jgi:Kdo2-lipid IVA lauroyltransferase/acyltransferase
MIAYCLALAVLKSLEWSPRRVAHWLACIYVRLLDLAVPRLRRVAYRNLAFALPNADHRKIVDGVFHSVARVLVALARFPRMEPLRCEGGEHFTNALRAGRGVLFATAHLGNWELSAHAHALLTGPMHVVVRPLDNPRIDSLVERRRAIAGNRVILKKDAARAILKALAANEAVGILIDQNTAPEEGVFIDFFGRPACANVGIVKLAARSGAAVIPGFALWIEKERGYALRFYPPVPMTGDAARDTQALQAKLEEVIREYPDQWLWIHNRWKTQPPTPRSNTSAGAAPRTSPN